MFRIMLGDTGCYLNIVLFVDSRCNHGLFQHNTIICCLKPCSVGHSTGTFNLDIQLVFSSHICNVSVLYHIYVQESPNCSCYMYVYSSVDVYTIICYQLLDTFFSVFYIQLMLCNNLHIMLNMSMSLQCRFFLDMFTTLYHNDCYSLIRILMKLCCS